MQQQQPQITVNFQNQTMKNSLNTKQTLYNNDINIPINNVFNCFNSTDTSNNDLNLLNRKRVAANGNLDENINYAHHPYIFGVQNNVNFFNSEKDREEKQIKIKAKKEERKNKELNAIQTKKSNTKESLDMALGIAMSKSNNGYKNHLNLEEKVDSSNKKNSNEDADLSDLSSEE